MNVFDEMHLKSLIDGGENHKVEFKQDFDWLDNEKKIKYIKGVVGLHNHDGGYFFFGVQNDGNIVGIGSELDSLDNADINKAISSYFQPSIHHWMKRTVAIDGLQVGVIHVEKRITIPSVCKKDYPKLLSESDIYYRYHSETNKIKYGDLLKLLTELSQTEQVQESKRVRKKDLEPFIKVIPNMFSGNEGTVTIKNVSENVAIIKKFVQLSNEGLTFFWKPSQDYGHTLNGGQEFKILGRSSPMLAHMAPYNIRLIYADKDGNLYFQDYSKVGNMPKETLPMQYDGEL